MNAFLRYGVVAVLCAQTVVRSCRLRPLRPAIFSLPKVKQDGRAGN